MAADSESLHKGTESSGRKFVPWSKVARVKRMETGVAQPVLDLTPKRSFQEEFRHSISFRSWQDEGLNTSNSIENIPKLTPRSSEEVNNAQDEVIEIMEGKLEALRNAAKLNLCQEILPTQEKCEKSFSKFDKRCMKRKPSKKLMELILIHQNASSEEMSISSNSSMAPHETPESDTMAESKTASAFGTSKESSSEQNRSDSRSQWDGDFDSSSVTSVETRGGLHRRTWSTEPLDSFIDGAQTKSVRLRSLGCKAKSIQNESLCSDSISIDLPRKSYISYKKISDPSRKILDHSLQMEQSIREKICTSVLSAGKRVLQSVWTWTVVAVIFAGVHVHSKYTSEASDSQELFTEDDPYDFEWDDNIDFDSDVSDED